MKAQRQSLHEIALRYGTDKAAPRRSLAAIYGKLLQYRRSAPVSLLEIGVFEGASLRMWKEYFYKGRIYGIDLNPAAKQHEGDRITVFIGEQTDTAFLDWVIAQTGPLDIIVDDGGHRAAQQIGSLVHLWTSLREAGVYIVEDTHTSYLSAYDMAFHKSGTTIEFLKGLVDDVHAEWHNGAVQLVDLECLHFYLETCVLLKRAHTPNSARASLPKPT